jgi:cobalt/nickel transport system permease protein
MIATLLWVPADLRLLLPAFIMTGLAVATSTLPLVLRRLRLLLPMLLALGVIVLLRSAHGTIYWSVAGVALSHEGFVAAGTVIARLLLIGAASLLFITVIPLPRIVAALQWMRLPRTFIAVAWLTERLLALLSADAHRMLESVRARSAALPLPRRILVAARVSGTFLLRAVGRSERLADALSARGFDGRVPTLQRLCWTARDSGFVLLSTCTITLLWLL